MIDSLKIGGAEVLLRDLVSGLLDDDFQIAVSYCTPGPMLPDFQAFNIPIYHLPRLARVDPFLILKACSVIRQFNPQILHTHLFKSDFHGRLAGRLCRVPVVISTLHNEDAWAKNPFLGRAYGATARFADHLIAVSEEVRQYHIRFSHLPTEKTTTILNGVDTNKFSPDPEAGAQLRGEFGISPTTPLVGIVGRLLPQKDHHTFLRAAKNISKECPDARFLIVGDGDLRDQLEARARGLGLEKEIIFCGIRRDIPRVMSALDVLVFSSLWEGLPVALLEGMATARPVVSTAVGGVPNLVLDGKIGFLVPPSNPDALASACLKIIQQPSFAQQLGKAGRRLVEAEYSIQNMIRQTIALYQRYLTKAS